jgi:hypothetical protein
MNLGVLTFAASVNAATSTAVGWDAETAIKELNALYMDFDPADDSTALGVSITFAGNNHAFENNLFCSGYVDTQCFNGLADCRMSAAHINHRVMVQNQGSGRNVVPLMGRAVGIVFNSTLTENHFGKCTYLYDGATSLNVNLGCGASAPVPASCDNPNSAFYNMCSSDGGQSYHHCTATDPQVVNKMCKCESCSPAYGNINPPRFKADLTCFYEMPALIVPHDDPDSFTPSSTNHLRDAMKQRVQNDEGTGQTQEWNEVVIDERLLIPQMMSDPAHTIVAFVYVNGAWMWDQDAKRLAIGMRDRFQETYGGSIPLLQLDAVNDFTQSGGPFKLPAGSEVV